MKVNTKTLCMQILNCDSPEINYSFLNGGLKLGSYVLGTKTKKVNRPYVKYRISKFQNLDF